MCLKNSISIQPNITFHGEDINNIIQVANLNDEGNCRRRAVSLRYIYLNSKINCYFEDTRNYNRLDQFVKHGCIDVYRLSDSWRIMELSNNKPKDISSYYNWENLAKLSEIVNIRKKELYKNIPLLMWASISKKMIKKRNYYRYNKLPTGIEFGVTYKTGNSVI